MKATELIAKYMNEGLSEAERHELEKLALEDDFVAEAWEGLQADNSLDHSAILDRLKQRLDKKGVKKPAKVVSFRRYVPGAIAASVAILAAALLLFRPDTDVLAPVENTVALAPIEIVENQDEIPTREEEAPASSISVVAEPEPPTPLRVQETQKKSTPITDDGADIVPAIAQTVEKDPIASAEPIEEAVIALETTTPVNVGTVPRTDGTTTNTPIEEVVEESEPVAFESSDDRVLLSRGLNSLVPEGDSKRLMANQSEPVSENDPLLKAKEALASKNYEEARTLAYEHLKSNPKSGESMALLGDIYIAGSKTCGDEWMQSLAVLAAMDKWKAAESMIMSSQTAQHIKDQIALYRSDMPKKDSGFMRGVKAGDMVSVDCWIEEEVVVRFGD